ncbi:putative autotransporter YadA-like, C-terminal domain protein [Pasteurella canis]|uniref:Putative autotransporter YadA-like, C-terminal domain protein n=1 Tax=Pasteurella canis TaxID=753 RepID=A0A379EVM3_9PAST|nr:YadA-like family protein [Pasteurella canis]SUC10410.1 putative autotransporter YadA-like, C-terminal domain protein [Pasteurella canis]
MLKKHNIFTLSILTLIASTGYSAPDSNGNIKEGNNAGTSVSGKNNIAISTNAGTNVTGNTNVAISGDAGRHVKGNNNIAIAYKAGNNVTGNNNTAIGRAAGSEVSGSFNLAHGYGTGQKVNGSSNISSGTYTGVNTTGNANIANGAYSGQNVEGNGNIATGNAAGVGIKGNSNIAIGNGAGTATDVEYLMNHKPKSDLTKNTINGPKRPVNNSVSLGTKAISIEDDAVALGSNSRADIEKGKTGFLANSADKTDATWTSTHAGISVGNEGNDTTPRVTRQIHNLAAGTKDTDAVNVAQLRKVHEQVADLRIDFQHIENKLNRMNSDLKAGIAGATAMANLPQAFRNGQSMVSVAVGSYRGQSAAAFGISRMADNSPIVFKASGSANTQGHFNVGAGIGWGW